MSHLKILGVFMLGTFVVAFGGCAILWSAAVARHVSPMDIQDPFVWAVFFGYVLGGCWLVTLAIEGTRR